MDSPKEMLLIYLPEIYQNPYKVKVWKVPNNI